MADNAPGSKLGIHLIARYSDGARKIAAANLPVMKVLDLHGEMAKAVADYKTRHPRGIVVLRVYAPVRYKMEDDPEEKAAEYWEKVLWPQLSRVPESVRRQVDYVEGPNEGGECPTWESVDSARWFCRFWLALSPRIALKGHKPCIGSIAVGNPPGTPEEVEQKLAAFVPALRQARKLGGAWSYHAYTLDYSTDVAHENWYSLRYRRFYDLFKQKYPDLASLPLILTEGGVDKDGTPSTSGWQARGSAEEYERWLRWFDSEIRKDPYVLGITLFQIGDIHGWPSFDLEPISDWMAGYLK